MKWSLQEFFGIWRLQFRIPVWRPIRFITTFPGSLYRAIKQSFFWLFHGYAIHTTWATDQYLMEEICFRLKAFRKANDEAYPIGYESWEEYYKDLDEFIDVWCKMTNEYYENQAPTGEVFFEETVINGEKVESLKFRLTEEEEKQIRDLVHKQEENDKKATELFVKLFRTLWY